MSGRGRTKRVKEVETTVDEEKPVKKTTKKKQFPVVAVITPDGIEGSLMVTSRKPLIVHLPLQSKDISLHEMPINYDPAPPTDAQPYDIRADDPFCNEMEQLPAETVPLQAPSAVAAPAPVNNTAVPTIDYYTLKATLLIQYHDSSEIKQIPTQSDAACFWCCHTFTHRPVVLPLRDTGDHLIVSGNFCSPECAAAHLFDIRQDSHTRWEQLALLYRVYGEACKNLIHPAPPRSILSLFGGPLSIEDYRGLLLSHQVRIDLHLPPMVSILATMDTKPIDFYDASLTKNVNETVKERLQKAEEVLRLRRTKPLKAWESTLDACINLKVKSDAGNRPMGMA